MKLEYDSIKIEKSEDFDEESFGISDTAVVIDILRSKLYSNPIKVLVQEYMSNARDAHREINKDGVPIEVFAPSDISPQFEVRDYGPGITPQRMKDVFVKYAASTKRDTNKLTGGFGLGSKSAWSYTDTFNVVSITNECGPNIKRTYSCIIDESRIGKLIKISDDSITNEECGVRIVIPVRKENFRQFRAYAIQAGTFWSTLPIIHGSTIEAPKTISEGTNWKYFKYNTLPPDYAANRAFVIYDGIPYPLKTETLKDSISKTVMDVLNCASFALYFGIGDITISANREEIQYTEKTRIELAKRVNELVEDFASKFSDTIQKEKTFLSALLKFNTICNENNVVAKIINDVVEWNGIKMHEMNQLISSTNTVKIENFFGEGGKLCHRKGVSLAINDKTDFKNVFVNDEPRRGAPKSKFESMYYNCPNRDEFDAYVISFHTNNVKGLAQHDIDASNIRIKKWKKDGYINELDFLKTSSIKKTAYPKGLGQSKPPVGKLIKYRTIMNSNNNDIFLTEHEDFDSSLSGYYVINHDGTIYIAGHHFSIRDRYEFRRMNSKFKLIIKHLNIDKIFVFTPKYLKLLATNPALIPLPVDINAEIVKKIDINKIKTYVKHLEDERTYNHEFFNLIDPMKHANSFKANSKVKRKLESMVTCKAYIESADYKEMSSIYSEFSDTIASLLKLEPKQDSSDDEGPFNTKYPLLSTINRYAYASDAKEKDKFIEHAISYINLVDTAKI